MKQIAIISGKGGTGKTSISASLASMASKAVFADCDVDAADLHLILMPEVQQSFDFAGAKKVNIIQDECIRCGLCYNICRFDAIDHIRNQYYVRLFSCEACDLCRKACPVNAIEQLESKAGEYYISDTRFGPLVHARLGIGEELSGKLVALVRDEAKQIAKTNKLDFLIIDGPPGIGCTAMASVTGIDLAVIVSEPTQSGLHDLKRSVELLQKFDIPLMILINKWDINPTMSLVIENYANDFGLKVVAKIPYSRLFTHAMIAQKSIIEFAPESAESNILRETWSDIKLALAH
jgi:MinD superfamily P-loop ATPase